MIEVLKDKYEVIRKIGQGGMAQIYLARDKQSGDKVAIKVLSSNLRNDIIKQKRFRQEMRLMEKVESEYVVKLFDGDLSSEEPYIVMEYVDGHILNNYIKNRIRLTVDEAVEFTKQLALGFDEIHKHGVVHRDIKSQNIMVAGSGMVKIIDFGIAIDDETESLTKTNMLIGSPQYVSPELINKDKATYRSDIYALGILLFEMLAGKAPFKGSDALDTLMLHKNKDMPRITKAFPNVPQALENVIIKSTAKKQSDRYKSMYDMFLDLKTCLSKERSNEKVITFDQKQKTSLTSIINSKWFMVGIVAILLVIVVALIIVFAMKGL